MIPKPEKIIQIITDPTENRTIIFALLSDGTVWRKVDQDKWEEIEIGSLQMAHEEKYLK